jgi:hypothetical protein
MKEASNIYRMARMNAARADKRLANRERAAALVYCSPEALNDYENGYTIPPCEVVQAMAEIYDAPELRGQHIRACCPLMDSYGTEGGSSLVCAALGWAVTLRGIRETFDRFAAVAVDGRISPEEIESARMVRDRAVDVLAAMQDTIDAIDKAMGGGAE